MTGTTTAKPAAKLLTAPDVTASQQGAITVKRNEFKHLISFSDAIKLEKRLSCLLCADKFSQKGAYRVKSLYFDSLNSIDFSTKLDGVNVKKKIRIRIYNEDTDKAKLELKAKEGIYQQKTSVLLSKEDALQLADGNFGVLLDYDNSAAKYIYTKLVLGCYSPAVIVEYKRKAFIHPEFNTRITFDFDIVSSELNLNLFEKNLPYVPILNDSVILEVKFNDHLLKFISDSLKKFNLNNISASKYCSSRRIFQDYII